MEDMDSPLIRRRQATRPRGRHPDVRATERAFGHEKAEDGYATAQFQGRAFPCTLAPYGCTSSFASKNEWTRHSNTQHFRLGYWRCDECVQPGRKPNDFSRKDLFVQHVRRMHLSDQDRAQPHHKRTPQQIVSDRDATEDFLTQAAERCYNVARQAPSESSCIFCSERWSGSEAFQARLEHIGGHMEAARRRGEEPMPPSQWLQDEATERWLISQGVLVRVGSTWAVD